jgi:hypothetical protein
MRFMKQFSQTKIEMGISMHSPHTHDGLTAGNREKVGEEQTN